MLERLDRLEVTSAGAAGAVQAALLAGWLISRLGWTAIARESAGESSRWRTPAGGRLALRLRRGPEQPGGLLGIRLAAGTAAVAVERLPGGECAALRVALAAGKTLDRDVALVTDRPAGELLLAALGAPGRDRVYEAALSAAARLLAGTDP
jgi:glucose-6-phosphate dehydrogenase assembly protein OpcA